MPALKVIQKPQITVSWITVHLIPHVLLKVLLTCDVHANAALAEGFGFDLVARARDGGDDDVGDRQTLFKRELRGARDVMPIEPVLGRGACVGSLGVFLRVALGVQSPTDRDGNGTLAWIESMSTENTRAPSFANSAARGRPTTSDLVQLHYRYHSLSFHRVPHLLTTVMTLP